jgi:hypothetical protein
MVSDAQKSPYSSAEEQYAREYAPGRLPDPDAVDDGDEEDGRL